MAKMIFDLNDELEERFRKAVADSKGLHKGVIKEALEEAVQLWMEQQIQEAKETKEGRAKKHQKT